MKESVMKESVMRASLRLLPAIGILWIALPTFADDDAPPPACPVAETISAQPDGQVREWAILLESQIASIANLACDANVEFDKAVKDYKSGQLTAEKLREIHSRWVAVQQAECELTLYSHLRIEDIVRLSRDRIFVKRGVSRDGAEIGVPAEDIKQFKYHGRRKVVVEIESVSRVKEADLYQPSSHPK